MSDNSSRQTGPDVPDNGKGTVSDDLMNGLSNEFETAADFAEPAVSPPNRQDTSPDLSARPEQQQKSKLLPITVIIVLLLVAGIAYFSATPDVPKPEQVTTEAAKSDVANAFDRVVNIPEQVETAKQDFAKEPEQVEVVVKTEAVITEAAKTGAATAAQTLSKPLLADSEQGDTQIPTLDDSQPDQPSVSEQATIPQAMTGPYVWALNLISVSTQPAAESVVRKLGREGVTVEIIQVNVKGKRFYRVRIANLTSRQEAIDARAKLGDNYRDAWISHHLR